MRAFVFSFILLLFSLPAVAEPGVDRMLKVLKGPGLKLDKWFESTTALPGPDGFIPLRIIGLQNSRGERVELSYCVGDEFLPGVCEELEAYVQFSDEDDLQLAGPELVKALRRLTVGQQSFGAFLTSEKQKYGQEFLAEVETFMPSKGPGRWARYLIDPTFKKILELVRGSDFIGGYSKVLENGRKKISFTMRTLQPYYVYLRSQSLLSGRDWESKEDPESGTVDLERRQSSPLENQVRDVFAELSKLDRPVQDWHLSVEYKGSEIVNLEISMQSPEFADKFRTRYASSNHQILEIVKEALPRFLESEERGLLFEGLVQLGVVEASPGCLQVLDGKTSGH